MKLPSLFDRQDRLDSISRSGDPLVRLSYAVSWEDFRPILSKLREKERKSPAGRKPFDVLLMFKTLVLQRLYNLSDHQVEFQIKDRLSFQRFLGLGLEDAVPDEKTIWAFREHLSEAGLEKPLLTHFERFLQRRGLKTREGSIVDATLVEVPIRRDSKEDNDTIKAGEVPPSISENPNVACQKDLDARWTKKHGKSYFGYKNHVRVDAGTKLIREYEVTPAHVHDSQVFEDVLKDVKQRHTVYADNAYANAEKEERLDKERGIYCLTSQRGGGLEVVEHPRSQDEGTRGTCVRLDGKGDGGQGPKGDWAPAKQDRHRTDEPGLQYEPLLEGILCADLRAGSPTKANWP